MDDRILQDTEYANTPKKIMQLNICLAYFEKDNLILIIQYNTLHIPGNGLQHVV